MGTLAFGETSPEKLSILWLITDANSDKFGVVVYGLMGFLYMTICAMFALFRMKLFQFYNMHPLQGTDANSLLFNSGYTLRVIFPLGYNFLQIFNAKFLRDTAFGEFLGQMNHAPVIGEFNRFLPLLILFFCIATAANIQGAILKRLGFSTFDFVANSENEQINSKVQEGKRLVARERRNMNRDPNRKNLVDKKWWERAKPNTSLQKLGSFKRNSASKGSSGAASLGAPLAVNDQLNGEHRYDFDHL